MKNRLLHINFLYRGSLESVTWNQYQRIDISKNIISLIYSQSCKTVIKYRTERLKLSLGRIEQGGADRHGRGGQVDQDDDGRE